MVSCTTVYYPFIWPTLLELFQIMLVCDRQKAIVGDGWIETSNCVHFSVAQICVKALIVCFIITSLIMQSDVYFLDFCGFIFNMSLVCSREDHCILQL